MMRLKSLGWAVTTFAVLGCGGPPSETPSTPEPFRSERAAAGRGPKKIVDEPTAAPSACTALYSTPQAQAALTQAVVDPGLQADGAVRTLILSFNTDEAISPALQTLTSSLGLSLGNGLGALQALPMVAITVPVTPGLVDLLRAQLQPLGLLSIYQDRPLEYFLDESVAYIGADTAREAFQATGAGVGVGVIDSGIDGTHGDFPNMGRNVKIVAPISGLPVGGALYLDTPNSDLTSGHGTHCASTIAGSGARSGGKYQGVAPGATLVGVGAGDVISILYGLQGFDFLLSPDVREAHNIRVISNSWGSSGSRFAPFDPLSIASKRAYDMGITVVFAAGNEGPGQDTLNPYSASPCVISVAAGTAKDTMGALNPLVSQDLPGELASFSSRGVPGDAFHHPDITLPGVNIVAARATTGNPAIVPPYLGLNGLTPEPFYSSISGTSMATPHLAGVVALMLEVNPALNLDGVLDALTSTAKPMHVVENGTSRQLASWEAGAGYADAYAAVRAASETAGTRYSTETTALPGWTGTVSTTLKLPVVDVTLLAAEHNQNLSVPAGASALRIRTDWGNPAYDLDLYVYGPNGELVASSANGTSTGEAVSVPNPAAGTWRVQLKGYLNASTSYTGSAEVDRLIPLP